MMKSISLLLSVLGIWVCVEIYTQGLGGAFGGALASFDSDAGAEPVPPQSVPRRAGAAVERAQAEASERLDQMLAE